MYSRSRSSNTRYLSGFRLLCFVCLFLSVIKSGYAADTNSNSSFGLTNYAFASYLGTGFYTTSGQNVFVLQLPFDHQIIEKTDTRAGWLLNLPVTIGLINFSNFDDITELPNVDNVATLTFLPGLQYQYPVTPNWTLIPFADYGFARDFNYTNNILIVGTGIRSYYNFEIAGESFTLGNRFLYAREQSRATDGNSDYSLIETGFAYHMTSDYSFSGKPLQVNAYYINLYYPDNLVFFERTDNPILVGMEHEVGLTFSSIPGFLFFDDFELGVGVRIGNEVDVLRIVFGAPF